MTPTQILNAARQRYNAVGDTFWSDDELLQLLYEGCLAYCGAGFVIESVMSTVSVANQQEYLVPTNTARIMRVTYSNVKLKPITFREMDTITLSTDPLLIVGTPRYYATWNDTFYLCPTPSVAGDTIQVFCYLNPQPITISSTLEIPTEFHSNMINYIIAHMNLKDKNYSGYDRLMVQWTQSIKDMMKSQRQKKIGDSFNAVQDEELLQFTLFGGA